jgi:hypothetical protein
MKATLSQFVIPGRASWRGPGIHNPQSWLWIPGSLASLTPRNDGFVSIINPE